MQPRLIFRTHYQVDEPAYVEFLIQACTSATRGTDASVVAARLKEEVERRCRRRFNVAAGAYGIHLAKALGLLTPYHTWTDSGHLVNLVAEVGRGEPERQLSLSLAEKVLHFRLFLESDGAVFIPIARYLKKHGSISQADVIRSTFVEDVFTEVLSAYIGLIADPVQRASLERRVEELRTRGYAGRTGQGRTRQHKLRLHMQVLHRLGLVERSDQPRGLAYRLPGKTNDTTGSLLTFLREVPNVATLERRMAAGEWATIVSRSLGLSPDSNVELTDSVRSYVLTLLARFYTEVTSQELPFSPLPPVLEAIQIRALAERSWLLSLERLTRVALDEAARLPEDVRLLRVRGREHSGIKLSDHWIRTASGW